eukprot:TRINITY_DN28392_c0_g1_i1.p1 TRINITY_DN28392_c0_g1~~TRINITY_DN28392_c0_g1_i1.p1  ORF type:complete len:210 (+),score=42.55 TRINITY_DN28392_c0_g1_i1:216-845(+)
MGLLEGLVKFLFEVVSDLALVPSLLLLLRNRRHFEMFIGVGCVSSAVLYNTCNAFQVSIFLTEEHWHMMNNVLTISYFLFLCIHLAHLKDEMTNIILRYLVFASVTVFQLRDGFWMESSYWTYIPCICIGALPVWRQTQKPTLVKHRIMSGLGFAGAAGVCFLFNLDINPFGDFYRFWHGAAHVLVGAALWQLWGAIESKKTELPLDWG